MKKIIPIIIVLALLAGGFFAIRAYASQQRVNSLNSYQTLVAERGNLTAKVGATGTVRANQTAILAWQTTGIVETVSARVGDSVESSQVLASLEQTSLPQNVILARADLVNSQKSLDDLLNSQLAGAQALQNLEKAEDALADLDEQTALSRAQAWDALLQSRDAYSKTLDLRESLDYYSNSQPVREARANYETLVGEVRQLRKIYEAMPGTPASSPEKAKALANLRIARFRLEQAKRILDLYGGDPTDEQYQQADADLDLARARLAQAQLTWDRIKEGADPAQKALLEAQLADAQRAYDRLKDGPDLKDIAALEARVAAAQATLDLAQLDAPFAGTITEVNHKPGDQATPGSVAYRLDDLSHLLVDVSISEVDINRVQIGQLASMSFDAILNHEYNGSVVEVAQVGSVVQGVVEFTVTVELTDADQAVKPGMTAAVNIVVENLEDVLLVPNRAVRVQDGERVVYVLRSEQLIPEIVTLGASSETMSEVLEGNVQAGDPIVLNPPQVFESNGPPAFMRR